MGLCGSSEAAGFESKAAASFTKVYDHNIKIVLVGDQGVGKVCACVTTWTNIIRNILMLFIAFPHGIPASLFSDIDSVAFRRRYLQFNAHECWSELQGKVFAIARCRPVIEKKKEKKKKSEILPPLP